MARVKPTKQLDILDELIRQAWTLSDQEIDSLKPGNIEHARSLVDQSSIVSHPFSEGFSEDPVKDVLRVLRNPDYFPFTCQYLFGRPDGQGPLEILPIQHVVLKELWTRQFPMLLGSRGFSKSFMLSLYNLLKLTFVQGTKIVIVASAFRQAKVVFEYMERIWHASPAFREMVGDSRGARGRESGPRRDIDRCEFVVGDSVAMALPLGDGCIHGNTLITFGDSFAEMGSEHTKVGPLLDRERKIWGTKGFAWSDEAYFNGVRPTKRITTHNGLVIEGTHNHKIKVVSNHEIVWRRFDEIQPGDRVPIDRTFRWHEGQGPNDTDGAYAVGLMVGDGSYTDPYTLRFATEDVELVEALRCGTGMEFKQCVNDLHHFIECGKQNRSDWLTAWGLGECRTAEKSIPSVILGAPRETMSAFLSGLYDTDGHIQYGGAKGGISVGFTNTSERLVRQMQYVLLHYGIISWVRSRKRSQKWATCYELYITGPNVAKFAEHINFRLKRKRDKLNTALASAKRCWAVSDEIPNVREEMARIADENRLTWNVANYDRKHNKVSTSKLLKKKAISHATAELFLEKYGHVNDPFIEKLRKLANPNIYYDTIVSVEDGECPTYDVHVPSNHEYCANGFFSHNTKIRGLRANIVEAEEFNSIPEHIYTVVVQGFGSVTADPVANVKDYARMRVLKRLAMWSDEMDEEEAKRNRGNQSILSGTAGYDFQHFAKYWREYKAIINSMGNEEALKELFKGPPPEGFDHRAYSIVRMPFDLIPRGFMDASTIARAQQTTNSGIFMMEYGAVFTRDSEGFFRRSLIERCVVGRHEDSNPPAFLSCGIVNFQAVLRGDQQRRYVYGVDPASERDSFAVTIIEIWPDHRRVVYSWTTNKSGHREKIKRGVTSEHNFFAFCARKLRDLMKVFPCERMVVDSQGGGASLREAFRDVDKFEKGELPILEVLDADPKKWKAEDDVPGHRLLEMVNFRDTKWTSAANHGMKKDLEDRVLLFPLYDPLAEGIAIEEDKEAGRVVMQGNDVVQLFDNLADCMNEIEEMKDELACIVLTQTPQGLEHWDVPEAKVPGMKKGVLRKDRYSSLVLANAAARLMARVVEAPGYEGTAGGFASSIAAEKRGPVDVEVLPYRAPQWFLESASDYLDYVGRRV